MTAVDVVIPAFGPEPLLARACRAVVASVGVEPRIVVVDNGYTGAARDEIAALPNVVWLQPGRNLGYAAGGNAGAGVGAAPIVAVLNSDAIVDPHALQLLVDTLDDPAIGLVTGRVLLLREPETINAAGNPVHYSLISWAGGWGEPALEHAEPSDPASASGVLLAMRRADWQRLGGFNGALFAYGEDVELSLRVWQSGLRVRYVPEATVFHDYDFTRNPNKFRLLERNRWINLLTLYETSTLRSLLPGLAVVELGIWILAARDGWLRQKAAAAGWVISHRAQVKSRRHLVQGSRAVPDSAVLPHLRRRIEPSPNSGMGVPELANRVVAWLGPAVAPRAKAQRVRRPTKQRRAAG